MKALQPFNVRVALSSAAQARLTALHETIVVAAYFYGIATPAGKPCADDLGEIQLGSARRELPEAGTAVISDARYDSSKLRLLAGREVRILVNVFSGRRSAPENLLDCDIFEDSVARAVNDGIQIGCKLLEESFPTETPTPPPGFPRRSSTGRAMQEREDAFQTIPRGQLEIGLRRPSNG